MVIGDGGKPLTISICSTTPRPTTGALAPGAAPQVYVPSLHDQHSAITPMAPRRSRIWRSGQYSSMLTDDTEFSGTLLVEITGGALSNAVFARWVCLSQIPATAWKRVLGLVTAQQQRDRVAGHPPVGKVGLISSAAGDYRDLRWWRGLVDLGVAIGISSITYGPYAGC